ncbi:transposase [candidate division MSBL1 archaeon SCGC-AAA259O05]|uniref:Transposase n=1 Tax=candidate division MSBL1 archaeon SCGC-AAA259O05 TaxID=1698271 RepID=A0A133V2U2_9EURY|nr:transposase [candidate division MSBL1 archaeon SCGC-AAA259O05]
MPEIKFGVTIDEELRKELDKIVGESEDLDLSRSEVVETILAAFFKSSVDHTKKARELIIKKRKGKL